MCVQNEMLTIAGEARVQNGTHPNPLPKTLTGPDLQRFGLVQTCRGMRGFTDFCLCSTRAKLAPVSAHLSICRNFTTASPCARHRVATGCRGPSHGPVCMYSRGCDAHPDPAGRRKHRPKSPFDLSVEPVSQARGRIVQRTETVRSRKSSPRRLEILCPECRRIPRTRGIGREDLPKNLTLLKKATLRRMRKPLPKNLTVTAAVSKMSMASDT